MASSCTVRTDPNKLLTAYRAFKVNPGHRHDEEHEKACDEKRDRIRDQHRFKSFFPEHDGNLIKWYVDGRDYFWVRVGFKSYDPAFVA